VAGLHAVSPLNDSDGEPMTLFRVFLATCLIVIVGYTSITIANHGANLLPLFFGDIV
jgi:hypothetical protein